MVDPTSVQAAARYAGHLLAMKAASRPLELDGETVAYVQLAIDSDEFREIVAAKIAERSAAGTKV